MMTITGVSILLLVVWYVTYRYLRSKLSTCKIYFVLLGLMALPGLFIPDLPLMGLYPRFFNFWYIVLFAVLMVLVLIPWIKFDKYLNNIPNFTIKPQYIDSLKWVFVLTIVLSLYSIVYVYPYASNSITQGALEVRHSLSEESPLPPNIFTTMAVGFASFSPVAILLAYISMLDKRLQKYTILLIISSSSYIVITLAICARDGFIYTSLTYVVLFFVFKRSLSQKSIAKIKRITTIIAPIVFTLFLSFSLARFFVTGNDSKELLYGTWGYLYQQPYVFDHVLDSFHDFYGFERRLSFLKDVIPLAGHEYTASNIIEYMFGTQFAEFYEISGLSSLIILSFLYILLFYIVIATHIRRNLIFPVLLSFLIYFYFTISGIFYFRFGGNNSEFLFFVAILLSSFFVPNILTINNNEK